MFKFLKPKPIKYYCEHCKKEFDSTSGLFPSPDGTLFCKPCFVKVIELYNSKPKNIIGEFIKEMNSKIEVTNTEIKPRGQWHKEILAEINKIVKSEEDSLTLYGFFLDLNQDVYVQAFNKGFDTGYEQSKRRN